MQDRIDQVDETSCNARPYRWVMSAVRKVGRLLPVYLHEPTEMDPDFRTEAKLEKGRSV